MFHPRKTSVSRSRKMFLCHGIGPGRVKSLLIKTLARHGSWMFALSIRNRFNYHAGRWPTLEVGNHARRASH